MQSTLQEFKALLEHKQRCEPKRSMQSAGTILTNCHVAKVEATLQSPARQ